MSSLRQATLIGTFFPCLAVVICCGYNHRNSTGCLSSQFRCSEKSFETPANPDRRNNNGKVLLIHFCRVWIYWSKLCKPGSCEILCHSEASAPEACREAS